MIVLWFLANGFLFGRTECPDAAAAEAQTNPTAAARLIVTREAAADIRADTHRWDFDLGALAEI